MNSALASSAHQAYHDLHMALQRLELNHPPPQFDTARLPSLLSSPGFEHVPVWVFSSRLVHERVVFVSPNVEALTGWPETKVRSAGLRFLYHKLHPEDAPVVLAAAFEVIKMQPDRTPQELRSGTFSFTARMQAPDSSYRWWKSYTVALEVTEEGHIPFHLTWNVDIHDVYKLARPICNLQFTTRDGELRHINLPSQRVDDVYLTGREHQVLRLVARGLTSAEIGDELHISKATVDTHRRHLLEKLGAHNAVDVTLRAAQLGLI